MTLNLYAIRYMPLLCALLLPSWASALGLGELRGQPSLGQGLSMEVDILGAEKLNLDASCFRLVQPTSGTRGLPWLKDATLNLRKGPKPVLEIRTQTALREPASQLAVAVGCGHEVSRSYVLFASPASEGAAAVVAPKVASSASKTPAQKAPRSERAQSVPAGSAGPSLSTAPRTETTRTASTETVRAASTPALESLPDRLMVSSNEGANETSLRFATDVSTPAVGARELREEQREILRLEYRMLQTLQEQATTQLATAEKLRNMETTLSELQQHATVFSERVDKGQAPATQADQSSAATDASSGLSEWSLYGILAGALIGFGGWLVWRYFREGQESRGDERAAAFASPAVVVDPKRVNEFDDVDLRVEPSALGSRMAVDVELDAGEAVPKKAPPPVRTGTPLGHDSVMSISATTLDEHFEANPVMELADIMLSFGRVKGAAQALQEYIDNNPNEALQPWIRLMDVYRMAGMRAEFESVARNLNQHFNVEIQQWDVVPQDGEVGNLDLEGTQPGDVAIAEVPRPESIEDMPRLMSTIVEMWPAGDVVAYLHQLLRDNRGGQRGGFSLQVVENILFLIELKEISNRMDA